MPVTQIRRGAPGGTRGEAPCSPAASSRSERWDVQAPPIRAMPASTRHRSERVLHIQRARGWRCAPPAALRAAEWRFRRALSPALRFPISTLSDGRRPAAARGAKPRARLQLHRVLSGGTSKQRRYAQCPRPRATAQNESSTSSGHEAGAPRQPCVPPAAQARRNCGSDGHLDTRPLICTSLRRL